MLYILLGIIIILIIVFYKKLKDAIEIEGIRQHNGILLEIKYKLESQDATIEQLFRELNISMLDTRTSDELR